MPALDTIASYQGTVGSTLAAGTMATGDPAAIRNFPPTQFAALMAAGYDDVTSPLTWRIRSPLLHDNVDGIQFDPGTAAPTLLLPRGMQQKLQAQDTLTFEFSTAASTGKACGAALIYYSQLPGAPARLYAPGDIDGITKNIKPVRIAIGSGANTAGQWYDLVITTTENLLHANTDYAVLGLSFSQAVAMVAVKGPDTGNLRCGVPGGTNNPQGAEFFVRLSEEAQLPCIPVINSANAGSTFVSIVSSAATGAAGFVTLMLAELAHNLS
ncbi:MAG TPA: hypothetical protein VMD08_03885 [Candidatus Baltobacteraceae bacterium]|nr:hypothetical protein [Candidatus Baltobacteraceae bacterium]